MKKIVAVIMIILLCLTLSACRPKDYVLDENTFFLVMKNIQYFPESYLKSNLEFDCFTYELTDVNGVSYMCGVRKCTAEYGCKCGNDTIIGFVLLYDKELPAPRNQSEDTNDKTWIHLSGRLKSADKLTIEIYAYTDGKQDTSKTEQILMLQFVVSSCEIIEDYSKLHYFVEK